MQWFYADGNEQKGPLDEDAFRKLVEDGVVRAETLVWQAGMENWVTWGSIAATALPADASETSSAACARCGRFFTSDQMIAYGDDLVCEQCKPAFFQSLREGAVPSAGFVYGGFWIRAAALLIDAVILMLVNGLVQAVFSAMLPGLTTPDVENMTGPFMAGTALIMLVNMIVGCAYSTWFVGRFAATPGKMACGLRVVLPDGGRVTYMRAFARYFAEIVSGLILNIGYIMAAFDEEKRTLHDRMCDTRVVRNIQP